mgnify:FL=1
MINSISFYIHWPWCDYICNFCDFYKFKTDKNINYERIFNCYIRDFESLKPFTLNKKIISINIGGGSPSNIKNYILNKIISYLIKNFKTSNNLEISIEANPDDITESKLKTYKKIGINRICIGVQSFENDDLKFLGRKYRKRKAINSILKASAYFKNIGIDLIYGVPGSNKEKFQKQLYYSRELPIKHISLYEFNFQNKKSENFVELKSFFRNNKKILEHKKFFSYDLHNFSINGYQSVYNNAVLEMKDYLGIGPSAHGRIKKKDSIIKINNTSSLENWLNPSINSYNQKTLNTKDKIKELLLLGLTKSKGVSINQIQKLTRNNFNKYIDKKKINILEKNKFLIFKKGRLVLTLKGLLVLNSIVSTILNYN